MIDRLKALGKREKKDKQAYPNKNAVFAINGLTPYFFKCLLHGQPLKREALGCAAKWLISRFGTDEFRSKMRLSAQRDQQAFVNVEELS